MGRRFPVAFALLAVAALASPAADVLSQVDPFIGTEGKGNTLPGPTAPFALIQPGPDSGSVDFAKTRFPKVVNSRYCNGYKRDDPWVIGFTQTHLSGTGCPDLSDFLLLPFSGEVPEIGWKDRATETSEVGYYAVTFTNAQIRTEITATRRCAIYRFTWLREGPRRLLLDLQHGNVATYSGLTVTNHVFTSRSRPDAAAREVTVENLVRAWLQNRHVAGAFRFSAPWTRCERLFPALGEVAARYVLAFDLPAGTPLEVRVGISGVDAAGARANLDAELGKDATFESVRAATREAWRNLLGRVDAKGTPDQLKLIYTSIYHVCQQPNLFSDVDGRYRDAAGNVAHTDATYYTGFSLWDTFRAVHPLYTLLFPENVNDYVNSFLSQYRSFGHLPIIPYFGRETYCMIGVHSIPVIVDAYRKGFRGFDAELAFEAVTNALTVTHDYRPRAEPWVPEEQWDLLDRYGYYPWDLVHNQGVSRTMELAYNAGCAVAFAKALGKDAAIPRLAARAALWTNHFDSARLLVRGRGADGSWREPFNPNRRTYCTWKGGDYTEACARENTWFVPHDPMGLIAAFGGKERFVRELSDFFWVHRQYRHDNEPSHQAPYQFAFAGRPDLTAKIVRETVRGAYSATSHAMKGNDDCGQMSAWYLFSSFGFYPFDAFSGEYVLGAPQLPEVTLHLPNGRDLHIVAKGLSDDALYVRSVTLNGRVVRTISLSHEDLLGGGELVFEMTASAVR